MEGICNTPIALEISAESPESSPVKEEKLGEYNAKRPRLKRSTTTPGLFANPIKRPSSEEDLETLSPSTSQPSSPLQSPESMETNVTTPIKRVSSPGTSTHVTPRSLLKVKRSLSMDSRNMETALPLSPIPAFQNRRISRTDSTMSLVRRWKLKNSSLDLTMTLTDEFSGMSYSILRFLQNPVSFLQLFSAMTARQERAAGRKLGFDSLLAILRSSHLSSLKEILLASSVLEGSGKLWHFFDNLSGCGIEKSVSVRKSFLSMLNFYLTTLNFSLFDLSLASQDSTDVNFYILLLGSIVQHFQPRDYLLFKEFEILMSLKKLVSGSTPALLKGASLEVLCLFIERFIFQRSQQGVTYQRQMNSLNTLQVESINILKSQIDSLVDSIRSLFENTAAQNNEEAMEVDSVYSVATNESEGYLFRVLCTLLHITNVSTREFFKVHLADIPFIIYLISLSDANFLSLRVKRCVLRLLRCLLLELPEYYIWVSSGNESKPAILIQFFETIGRKFLAYSLRTLGERQPGTGSLLLFTELTEIAERVMLIRHLLRFPKWKIEISRVLKESISLYLVPYLLRSKNDLYDESNALRAIASLCIFGN